MFDTQERELAVSDLNEKNQPLLQALNLSGIISKNISVINPRHKAVAIWVGVDTHTPLVNPDNVTIDSFAQGYFKLTNQELDTLYWLPVVKVDTEYGHSYKAVDNKSLSVNDTAGFIFVSDDEIQIIFDNLGDVAFEQFGDDAPPILDTELESAANSVIDSELAEYSMWANSGFVDMTISSLDDEHVEWVDGASDVNTAFETLVATMKDNVDCDRNTISMILQISNMADRDSDILSKLTEALQNNFGAQFIYGNYNYNSDRKEFSVTFIGNKIPALSDIVRETGDDIAKSVKKHSKSLVGAGMFDSLDIWDVKNSFTSKVAFNDLPELISHALIYSFIETVVGMDIIQISHKNKY